MAMKVKVISHHPLTVSHLIEIVKGGCNPHNPPPGTARVPPATRIFQQSQYFSSIHTDRVLVGRQHVHSFICTGLQLQYFTPFKYICF